MVSRYDGDAEAGGLPRTLLSCLLRCLNDQEHAIADGSDHKPPTPASSGDLRFQSIHLVQCRAGHLGDESMVHVLLLVIFCRWTARSPSRCTPDPPDTAWHLEHVSR